MSIDWNNRDYGRERDDIDWVDPELKRAREALAALQELTGSNNSRNPWLGVTAAVALIKDRLERCETSLVAAVGLLDEWLWLAHNPEPSRSVVDGTRAFLSCLRDNLKET